MLLNGKKLFLLFVLIFSLVAGAATMIHAEDAAAPPPDSEEVDADEVELTYQEQASALVDIVIEDYTVRMAALQAIIDMKDDEIAGNKDNIKKLNDTNKKLTTAVKTTKTVSTSLRTFITTLPDSDDKTSALDSLDRLDTAVTKALEQ